MNSERNVAAGEEEIGSGAEAEVDIMVGGSAGSRICVLEGPMALYSSSGIGLPVSRSLGKKLVRYSFDIAVFRLCIRRWWSAREGWSHSPAKSRKLCDGNNRHRVNRMRSNFRSELATRSIIRLS